VIRLLVVVALAACGGKKDAPAEPAVAAPVPRVADSAAILPLAKAPRPTHVVWIDAGGALEVAPADKVWTGGLPAARQAVADLDALAAISFPDEAAVRDPWSFSSIRSLAKDAERGFQRAPAAIGVRDLDDPHVLVLASPAVDALRTVRVIRRVGGRFGVALPRAQLGALRFVFRSDAIGSTLDETRDPWVEMHLGTGGIDVLSLPSTGRARVAWGKATADELRAIAKSFGREPPKLDVFVGAGVTHQQLIDTLVALDGAGVTTLFLGSSPGPADGRHAAITQAAIAQRGAMSTTAILVLGQPNAQGDLERAEIKRVVRQQAPALLACYDTQLAKQSDLRGTVQTQFFIAPTGIVVASSASGVDPAVAVCIADLLKTVEFPKPKGGGGVQVSYPFTFRPRET
jgi:hypothetical protein